MKKTSRQLVLGSLALGVALLGSVFVRGDAGVEPVLVLEASVGQETFVVGEPVLIHLELTNVSSEELVVFNDLRSNTGMIRYEISRPDATSVSYKPADMRDPGVKKRLQPGQTLTHLQDLRLLREQWPAATLMFPVPGDYRVAIDYEGFLPLGVPRPEPATLAIRVTKANTDLGLFSDPHVGRFFAGDGHDKNAVARLRAFLNESGDPLFRQYARYFLGRDCVAAHITEPQSKDTQKIVACAGTLLEATKNEFQFRDLAFLELANAELRLGHLELARRYAEKSQQISERLEVRRRAAALLGEISRSEIRDSSVPNPQAGINYEVSR